MFRSVYIPLGLPLMIALVGCPTPVSTTQTPQMGTATADYSPVPKNTEARARMGQAEVIDVGEVIVPVSQAAGQRAQADIRAGHHSTYSGTIVCTGCPGPFMIKVSQFVNPSPDDPRQAQADGPMPPTCGVGTHGANIRFPPVVVQSTGPFAISTPWHGGQVVIEVTEDTDGNGAPSPGERFVVLHEGGRISGREDRAGLVVNMDQAPPMVAIGKQAAKVAQSAGEASGQDRVSP